MHATFLLINFHTFTRKYAQYAYMVLTLLLSTYHFWGAHNQYQDKLSKIDIWVQLWGVGHMSDMAVLPWQKSCTVKPVQNAHSKIRQNKDLNDNS